MQWIKVKAGDIVPGDVVARARTHTPREVTAVQDPGGSVAVWITLEGAGRVRPRRSADWWKLVKSTPDEGPPKLAAMLSLEGKR